MAASPRTLDELQDTPHMATLHVLSACIRAVSVAIDFEHPDLLSRPSTTPLDTVALLLRIHLDECQKILREYDALYLKDAFWSDGEAIPDNQDPPAEPDYDDIPW